MVGGSGHPTCSTITAGPSNEFLMWIAKSPGRFHLRWEGEAPAEPRGSRGDCEGSASLALPAVASPSRMACRRDNETALAESRLAWHEGPRIHTM